ncbi:hypothetical protein [Deinococcus aestuarii]|uniref:pPIWI_RE_Z domain-containing protein n=1 Tax=Deinococcus aestuarii TaxID=2774531 RepID=UPI001C0B52D6|nr:hypothetical protein [Deinococcus aestuarii]
MTADWTGAGEIQWACLLMEQLGEGSLAGLPLLLSGFRSVDTLPALRGHEAELRRLRGLDLLPRMLSPESVRAAMQNARQAEERQELELAYELHPADLTFRRRETHAPLLALQLQELQRPQDEPPHRLTLAPADTSLVVRQGQQGEIRVRLPAAELPPAPTPHTRRERTGALTFTLDDLAATAADMDRRDAAAERPDRGWGRTIDGLKLRVRGEKGFEDGRTLDLEGLHHLIGLPGAGKTTLINVLCVHMARRGQRVAVFTTAIEVARQGLEILTRYLDPAEVALLVGRGHDTHESHADRIAGVVAAGDPSLGGFGRTIPGMDRFARGCALRAYATTEEDVVWEGWGPEQRPPCEQVLRRVPQEDGTVREQRHLCPLFSRCGRVHNHAQLVEAKVWLGHVLSTTARVPAHLTDRKLSYAELLPEVMDLVIVDEADEAQANLDAQSLVRTPFLGKDGLHKANSELASAYYARSRGHKATYRYLQAAHRLDAHLREFSEVIRDPRAAEFSGQLLTSRAIFDVLARQHGRTLTSEARAALAQLWDTAVYDVLFGRENAALPTAHLARNLGIPEAALLGGQQALREAFDQYQRSEGDEEAALASLEQATRLLMGIEVDARGRWALNLLLLVSLLVTGVRRLRALAAGVDLAFKHTYLPDQGSQGLGRYSTTSLLGNFAAISFLRGESDDNQVEMIVQDRVSRLLPERLSRAGLGVLITSATSFLPESTSYHSTTPPDYLLLPIREGREGKVTLRFSSQKDASGRPIRVSGAGADRDDHLRELVRGLAGRSSAAGALSSQLERDLAHVAEELSPPGRPRKAALVVNSYEQVEQVMDALRQVNPALHSRSVGLTRARVPGRQDLVLRAEIEGAARRDDLSVLVFPMGALGRGVNMVLGGEGETRDLAAIGVMYFLVRPHPTVGDTTLLHSLVNRATEEFDSLQLDGGTLADLARRHRLERAKLYRTIRRLLERPQQMSQLPKEALRAFTANLIVPVWQTIGRAIRGGADAEIHFVDAAWAPESAAGGLDRPTTSVLAGMQRLLAEGGADPDPHNREVLQALYGSFARALCGMQGLLTQPTDLLANAFTSPDDVTGPDDGDWDWPDDA